MSHHPPDWFCDSDEVDEKVCNRSTIHLFGHKHRQRISRDVNYIRFSAGAVNPERNEVGWSPAYNLIDVNVVGDGPARKLEIEAHLLQLQSNPERYRPVQNEQGEPVFRHSIAIPGHVRQNIAAAPALAVATVESTATENVEAAMSDEGTRNLIFRFWKLTMSQRREIALELGLIDKEELQLPEPERYGRALLRAGERGLIEQVAQEIARREKP
jgi:hypothetical protein